MVSIQRDRRHISSTASGSLSHAVQAAFHNVTAQNCPGAYLEIIGLQDGKAGVPRRAVPQKLRYPPQAERKAVPRPFPPSTVIRP